MRFPRYLPAQQSHPGCLGGADDIRLDRRECDPEGQEARIPSGYDLLVMKPESRFPRFSLSRKDLRIP